MNQKEIVDSVFRMAEASELLEYLKELASKDVLIASEMEHRFLSGREWDYKSEIDEAFGEIIEHQFYEETMHDWNAITRNCRAILSKARAYMNAQRYAEASDVGLYMLETLLEVYNYSEIDEFPYDEDYMIIRGDGVDYDPGKVGFVKEAAEFVENALSAGKSSKLLAMEEFTAIMARFKSVAVGIASDRCIDGYRDALSIYNGLARTIRTKETFFEEQLSILENGGGEDTASDIYEMLSSAPVGSWTLEKFARKYIKYSSVAGPYVAKLEAEGRTEDAISAIMAHFGRKYPDSAFNPLGDKLYELIWKTSDENRKREIASFYFFHRSDKIRYYHDLKSVVRAEEWTAVLSGLLKCSDYTLFSVPEWKYQIYEEEGMNMRLMELITSSGLSPFGYNEGENLYDQISHFRKYGKNFSDEERDMLVNEFTVKLYNAAPRYNAKNYHCLADSIKMLSRISPDARTKMDNFINFLKSQYPRRRKMLELL